MAYMSDVPHDRYTQLHECRRDLEFELPCAKVSVYQHHIQIRLTYEDALALVRLLTDSATS